MGSATCKDAVPSCVSLCKLARSEVISSTRGRRLHRREVAMLRGRVGLVSYPRSGSTLFRLLLEQHTGLCTGSDASLRWPLVFLSLIHI